WVVALLCDAWDLCIETGGAVAAHPGHGVASAGQGSVCGGGGDGSVVVGEAGDCGVESIADGV
ncbi:hypothetical protein HK405_004300, partial [Cladochytrium tenue]